MCNKNNSCFSDTKVLLFWETAKCCFFVENNEGVPPFYFVVLYIYIYILFFIDKRDVTICYKL
jgi:hypothetical protein